MAHPVNIADSFPPYLRFLFDLHLSTKDILGYSVILLILSIILWVYLEYLTVKRARKIKYTFLEIKPTDRTLKSPLSTDQLFTVLHSLIKDSKHSWFINTKRSISFEIVSTKEDGIRFILRVPEDDQTIIYRNLLAYLPGIEINYVDDYFYTKSSRRLITQELKLKDSYLYPLEKQEYLSQFDPIAYITTHMTQLTDDEMVAAHFICIPVSDATHSKLSSFIKEVEIRLLNNLDISDLIRKSSHSLFARMFDGIFYNIANLLAFVFMSFLTVPAWLLTSAREPLPWWLLEKSRRKNIHELGMNKQTQYQSIHSKVSQPLFETTIRFFASANNSNYATQRLKGMFSAFETLNTSYQKVKSKTPFFSYIDHKLAKKYYNMQLTERLSLYGNNPILSVSELSSLYHLPYTSTTKTEDLLHVKSPQLASPLSLKQSDTKLDIVFANNKYGGITTPVGQTLEQRRRHTYVIGATGTGKSTLLLQMMYQDLINGKGFCLLDPHGDLCEFFLGLIPKERWKDVVYFNPRDIEHQMGINIFKLPKNLTPAQLAMEKTLIVSGLIATFRKLYPERYSGPSMEHIIRNIVLTALEIENPTLETVYLLLTDYKFRTPIVNKLTDPLIKQFWKSEFNKVAAGRRAERIAPITNKLSAFLTTILVREILTRSDNTLDLEDIMNNKKILLCNLSKGAIGEDNSFFLGGLLITEIQRVALRRINIPEDQRVDFNLYIDEFQNFANQSFESILSEARKYKLNLIIAHQNTTQIEPDLLQSILANCGTTISFRNSSPDDEEKLLPVFAPKVEQGQIMNLPSYTFYIKINALQPQDVFTGEVEKFNIEYDQKAAEEVIELSRQKYGKKLMVGSEQVKMDKKTTKNKPRNQYER